jgi:hypothetical protein
MRPFASIFAAALAALCATAAHAQPSLTFGGISWEGGIEGGAQRLRAQGYRFVGADSTNPNHLEWSFTNGRTGDSVMVMFAPAGLRSIWWHGGSLPEARALEAYRVRHAALTASHGPGSAGVSQPSWSWKAADRSWVLLSSRNGRLQETYFSPHLDRISAESASPRIVQANPQRGAGWYAGRVNAATWRPVHVADSLAVSWDSAGATTLVQRLVTARVRWDWRDVHVVSANPPFDAEEREVRLDCRDRKRQDRDIRYYRNGEMVYQVPLSGNGPMSTGPAGPEWERIVRALCRLVEPGSR